MTEAPEFSPATSVVRIRALDGTTAGVGALVNSRHVITCAHVVNSALGFGGRRQERPDDPVTVEFPLLPDPAANPSRGRVSMWLPPPELAGTAGDDLAGIILERDPPDGAVPARLSDAPARPGLQARVLGFPESRPEGAWVSVTVGGTVGGGRLQLESSPDTALRLQAGYSGGPVYDEATGHIVGLVSEVPVGQTRDRDGIAISARQLREAWPEAFGERAPTQDYVTDEPMVLDSGLAALRSAVVSPGGALAATYGTGPGDIHSLTIWDLRTGDRRNHVTLDRPPVSARFTQDESALIVVTLSNRETEVLRLPLDTQPVQPEAVFAASDIRGIALSRDSRTAVLLGGNGTRSFDTESRRTAGIGTERVFDRVAIAPYGDLVAALAEDDLEIVGALETEGVFTEDDLRFFSKRDLIKRIKVGPVSSMDCSSENVLVASGNSVSVVWSKAGGEPHEVYSAPEPVRRIAVGSAGSMVAVAHGGKVTVVDLATREPILDRDADSPVTRLTFRLDDKVLVTAHEDNAARLWNLPDRRAGSRDNLDWQSDAPARTDLLQRQPLASALAARLRRFAEEERTSFLVHVDGPWGSGKSTLLRLLREELERGDPARPEWLTIDFNAWQQSKVGASWWALLAALRRDVTRERAWPARFWLRATETWTRFRRSGAPFILAFLVLVALAAGLFFLVRPSTLTFRSAAGIAQGASALIAAVGILWAGSRVAARFLLWDSAQGARLYEQSSVNPMLDVSRHFGWLVAKSRKPVVFLIDDLDRCTDAYVVELLETVQTLVRDPPGSGTRAAMTPPSFVVAADGAWIRRSFETSYSQFGTAVAQPGVPLGYLFLDKLFQLRVRVPRLEEARREQYLRYLLRTEPEEVPSPELRARVAQARDQVARSSGEDGALRAYDSVPSDVRDLVAPAVVDKLSSPAVTAATEHWLQRFAPLLPPNPRAMKRFINDYSILRTVRTLEGNAVGMGPLALWVIIEIRWPSLADYLCAHPAAIELVGKSETGSGIDDVPPELAALFTDADLRRLVTFGSEGPLTAELIAQCCGMGALPEESLTRSLDQVR